MVEIGIGCQGRIEIFTMMIRMAAVALPDILNDAVRPILPADLTGDIYVTIQAKHILRRFKRLVAATAICLESRVRFEALKGHARAVLSAQPARTESHTTGAPQDNAQPSQQEGGQQETKGG
jgi:hypothetical protein